MLTSHAVLKGVYFLDDLELWTTARCAQELRYTSDSRNRVVDKMLRRKGITPYIRLPGRNGQNLWNAQQVWGSRWDE